MFIFQILAEDTVVLSLSPMEVLLSLAEKLQVFLSYRTVQTGYASLKKVIEARATKTEALEFIMQYISDCPISS